MLKNWKAFEMALFLKNGAQIASKSWRMSAAHFKQLDIKMKILSAKPEIIDRYQLLII